MSMEWPPVVLEPDALAALPLSRVPSATLKRACRRYIIALGNLNKQVVAYNTEVQLRRLQSALSHEELRSMLQQCALTPFVSAPVTTVSPVLPQLITLHRAFQCVHVLKDTLDSWDVPPMVAPPGTADSAAEGGSEPPPGESFSLFSTSIV